MTINNDVVEAIGNTPLIRLKRASEIDRLQILGKAEFMNPGQSVKDRAALFIIRDAVARGALRPGGVIVEGTAGNTGIGLALVGNALGFRTVIVIPKTQSQEKKDMLRLCGAELVEVPAVPYANPEQLREALRPARRGAGRRASRTARSGPTSSTTSPTGRPISRPPAPEIWEQTDGKVDGFICAVGTGGTLAGVALGAEGAQPERPDRPRRSDGRGALQLLQARRAEGRGLLDHRGHRPGPHHRQSRGRADRRAYQITDDEALPLVFDLLAARRPVPRRLDRHQRRRRDPAGASDLGPGHTIVTILCDYGTRYQSKLFNPEFLRSKNLPVPDWLETRSQIEVPFEAV